MPGTRRTAVLLLILLTASSLSYADRFIESTPAPGQISKAEAIKVSCLFAADITGEKEEVFSSSDGIWCVYLDPAEDTILDYGWSIAAGTPYWLFMIKSSKTKASFVPTIYIDAKTGGILYWKMSKRNSEESFYNGWPLREEVQCDEACLIADRWVKEQYDPIEMNTPFRGTSINYVTSANEDLPHVWHVSVSYNHFNGMVSDSAVSGYRFICDLYIDARNGHILVARKVLQFDTGSEIIDIERQEYVFD